MAGLNENLPEKEKVQCLFCLTSDEPEQKQNGTLICSSCGKTLQAFPNANDQSSERPIQH